MKLVRFALAGRVQYGSLQGDQIQPLEGELHALTVMPGATAIPLGSVKLLTPTAASKVIAMIIIPLLYNLRMLQSIL